MAWKERERYQVERKNEGKWAKTMEKMNPRLFLTVAELLLCLVP